MKHLYSLSDRKTDSRFYAITRNALHFSIPFLVFFLSLLTVKSEAQICCPQFKLQDAVEICPPDGACKGGSATGGVGQGMVACKLITHEYTVYPNDPGFTYTWTITGGTPGAATGNPVNILWGSGAVGYIKVVISNLGFGGYCKDSILQEICLIDGPKANFNLAPTTVCSGIPVHFTNTSSGGSNYLWDFGDGTTSTLANPPDHSYSIPATYTVTLTATNAGPASQNPDHRPPCGCTDRISKTVTVLNGAGPTIDLSCCFGTVCAGDTSSFCTSTVCTTYNWSVTNGTIISGLSTNCIKVKWNSTYTGPTTVSLTTPGCALAPCAGTTTLNVPVLYPNFPMNGPNTLCVGASGSYFLPLMPGTYYLWTTTAPPFTYSFNDLDKNTPSVNISFSQPGVYQLKCQYNNPMAGCSGISIITINVLPEFSITGDETVCQGSTVTYSTSGGNATWAVTPAGATVPAGPSSSSNIIWNLPGTYTITATTTTSGVFCNPTAVKVVQVIAKPILGNITGTLFACPGKNFTFGITSNKQGSPFVWGATGGGIVMSQMGADRDSAVIKLNGTGPWTISVYQKIEISPGNYCQSLTKTLVVNPYPAPVITGNGNVCVDALENYAASGPTPPGGIQWSIFPPYQGSIMSGQGTNGVTILWHGTPNTATIYASHCGGTGIKTVTIVNPPFVAPISANGPVGYCLPNMPNNLTLSTTSGFFSYQWYLNNSLIGGANAFTYNIPNATFTGQGTYYFSVIVSNGSCNITKTTYIYIDSCAGGGSGIPINPFLCTIDFTINPNPACENQPVTFTAVSTPPGEPFSYAWDFGDAATSFQSPTDHAYISAGTDTVTLTATLGSCVVVKKKVVTVNPTPYCTISASDTAFCPGGSVTLYACLGMNSYQWYRNGSPISGANGPTYTVTLHGEYQVEVTNGVLCANKSNSIYIYLKTPPIAHVTGDGLVCAYPSSPTSVQLSAYYDPAYIYDWTSNAPGATFSPNNSNSSNYTMASLTVPAILPVTYYFVVEVTDTVTTCVSRDTLCVTFYETPLLSFPYFESCVGTPATFTPSIIDTTKYSYHWSNGKITPVITAISPGTYALTITDKTSGCSATATAGVIHPKPDLSLFPHGCDSIMCKTDTLHMYIPLPLNFLPPFNTYASAYQSIKWYDNGNYITPIASGQNFNFVFPASGSHQISVVVKTNYGCPDTAGVYCLTVICGDIQFGHCPTSPIILPCNPTHPTNADALGAVGAITDSCPGPINIVVTGGIPVPLTGCYWTATFTITATNACGQTAVCYVTYKWKEDTEPPVFSKCPNGPIKLPCNATHPTTADALALVGSVTDNCPGTVNVVVSGGVATPTSGCNWTATFIITATDSCNNSAVCNVKYNWKEDTQPPQFGHCPSGPIVLPCNTRRPGIDDIITEVGGVTDNCPDPVNTQITGGIATPSGGCNWTSTFIIIATDACGNKSTCSVTYIWKEDHTPPQFAHCPASPINLPCNSVHPTEADALNAAGPVTDNCPGVPSIVVSGGVATPTNGCNWTSVFTITATDSCGNASACTVTYNWKEDITSPQFTHCPQGPINLPCNAHPILEEILYEIGPITDNCTGHIDVQVTGGTPIPTTGCNWTATYTLTATDSCGNVNVCNATYNWREDHQAPVIAHCPAGPINLPCNAPRPKEADALAAAGPITDNCPGVIIQVSGGVATPTTGCNWTSTFTITASDSCGNATSCVITYNWKEDLTPPQFTHCPQGPINLPCNSHPIAGEILYEIGPITDNCPGHVDVQLTGGVPTPTTGCNWTATYTITATDSCGNSNVCTITYNWSEDHTPPAFAFCPAGPISLGCNVPRPTEQDALGIVGPVTDNCTGTPSVQVTGGLAIPSQGCNWTSSFIITASDSCGNISSCTVTFTWKEDHTPPVYAHCPSRPITLPCNSPRPTTDGAVLAAGPVTDDCYIDNIQVTDGGVIPTMGCGYTETFTLTATDGCGNVTVCHVIYNWKEDLTPPEFAHCPSGPIELGCNSPHPTDSGALAAAGAVTDNCPGNVFVVDCLPPVNGQYGSPTLLSYGTELSIRNFVMANFIDCNPPPSAVGQTEIHTNSSTATFEFSQDSGNTWVPVQAPATITEKITKIGETGTERDFVSEVLSLNISGGSLPPGVMIRESPSKQSTGETRIEDAPEGFLISSFFDIFTEISPDGGQTFIAAIQPINIILTGAIIVHVIPGSITSTVGCGYTQTYTLSATDACGNTKVCHVTYNWKEDHIPPVFAHCPDGTINLPCNSIHPTTNMAVDAAGPVTDNCYIDNIQVTDGGVISLAGCWFSETFTLTAVDGCGNTAVCHVTYTWKEDHIKPTFTRPDDITIYRDNNGNYNSSVSVTGDVTDEADNCSVGLNATFTDEVTSGIAPVWRMIRRSWMLVDDCGNAADNQVQTITVLNPSGGKTLTLSVLLEGLYNGSGTMFQAQTPIFDDSGNVVGSEPKWPDGSADHITVELHHSTTHFDTTCGCNLSDYPEIEYSAADVPLGTTGIANVSIPDNHNGLYYLTVRQRNHIETTSALPVDFSGAAISYAFDALSKAYGGNLTTVLEADGESISPPLIFGGDENQDGMVEADDLNDIGNAAAEFLFGYLATDIYADGQIEALDLNIAGNNTSTFITRQIPK